jgi:hypothetical protein
MRNLTLIYALLITSCVYAQKNPADTTRKRCITAQGVPYGNIASATLGKQGGSIVSDDGNLELIFPQGALEKNTTITIQAQSSTMPASIGTSYKMEPSGTVFKQPVKVVMHYNDNELKEISKEILSLALQSSNAQWSSVKDVSFDTINKTISGFINHFSSLVVYQKAMLQPKSKTIKVNNKFRFYVTEFITVEDIDFAEIWEIDMRIAFYDVGYFDTKEPPLWSVNGRKGGDALIGTISQTNDGFSDYTAPAKVPDNNPVTVSVEMQMAYEKRPVKIVLASTVHIVEDAYRFTFIGVSNNMGGVFKMLDSSSCDVVIEGNKVRLINIVNHKPWSDWPRSTKGGCRLEYPSADAYKGLVEISGMTQGMVVKPKTEKGTTTITASLLPAMGNTPEIIEICKERRHSPSMPLPAQPTYIRFETDGTDINIEYMGLKGKNEINHIKKGEGFVVKVSRL